MSDLLELQARIEKLERRATSQRNLIIGLLAACALAATVATTEAQDHSISFTDATTSNTVTLDANGLVFRDKDGGKRMELKAFSDGDGAMQIFDKSGTRRVYLGFNSTEDPTMMLDGTDGKPLIEDDASANPDTNYYDGKNVRRAVVGLTTESNGVVRLYGTNGNELATLEGPTTPFLQFFDTNAVERATFGLTTQNSPFMRMFGINGKMLLSMEAPEQPFMRIYDNNETERMWVGMTDSGDTGLEMYSPGHNERAYLGIYSDGKSGAAFYDANGSPVWHSQ